MSKAIQAALLVMLFVVRPAMASDHLDTAAVIADPAGDIGDLYAWTSHDGKRLNLVMTIVGRRFSDHVRYEFHVDSARRMGETGRETTLSCIFDSDRLLDCHVGDADQVRGDATGTLGIRGVNGRFRVFAGLRDDPFFNNVRGTRAALNVAAAAMAAGVPRDAGGCPAFDAPTVARIHSEWRHTDGHAAGNFLAGWPTAALVIEVDLDVVTTGGPLLGVWATTVVRGVTPGHTHELDDGVVIDRMGRALTGNMLLGTFATDAQRESLRSRYNQATRAGWSTFMPELAANLAVYDAFDGHCGNQWLAVQNSPPTTRYAALAELLADDRLWVDSASRACQQYLAVEFDHVGAINDDCGGRTPRLDAVDVFRSLLSRGEVTGLSDGVDSDDRPGSEVSFPFLTGAVARSPE